MTSTRRAIVRNSRTGGACVAASLAAGLFILACSGAANAGFVDERLAVPAVKPAVPATSLAAPSASAVALPVAATSASIATTAATTETAATTATTATAATATAGAAVPTVPVVIDIRYRVSREDKTIREGLVRWSKRVGWTFEPENWTVKFDLPVLASAESEDLGADYKTAVRALLASTDLTNLPLQPCFYSNNVLRVVPKAELCDKTAN